MKKILEIHGSRVLLLQSRIGQFPAFKEIEAALKKNSVHAVAMVHHETSTGMLNPLKEIGALAKKYNKTFVVDAISSLGGETIDFKKNNVDLLAGTSGKCLHGFPGVSFVLVSKKKIGSLSKEPRSLTLDLAATLESEKRGDTRFTPVVQIFYAFDEALKELAAEGLNNRIDNYRKKHARLVRGFRALGLVFLVEVPYRSHVLTALWTPEFIAYDKLHDTLKKQGFVIYAGQSGLKGKIFRIANLGDVTMRDIERLLSCLKRTLKK